MKEYSSGTGSDCSITVVNHNRYTSNIQDVV